MQGQKLPVLDGVEMIKCACVARDAHACLVMRCPEMANKDPEELNDPFLDDWFCECPCHDEEVWENEDEWL